MMMLEVGWIVELRRILREKTLERSAGNLICQSASQGAMGAAPSWAVVYVVVRSVMSCLVVVSRNIAAFIGYRAQPCVGPF